MVNKRKLLTITSIFIGSVLLILVAAQGLDYLNQQTEKKVVEVGVEYAKQACHRLEKAQSVDICSDLQSNVTPPPDWGTRKYILYVTSKNPAQFESSMYIEVRNGEPKISDFVVSQLNGHSLN